MNTTSRVQRRKRWYHVCLLCMLPFVLSLVGCVAPSSATQRAGCPSVGQLVGEGSTFDAPLFDRLFSQYPTRPCGVPIVYYASGSGAGISQMLNQLVDFGATDAPLTDRQLASSPNGVILHVPITLGAVAIGYHLSGVSSPLRLSGDLLAAIYQGSVTFWDDPTIQSLNGGVNLPHQAIQVLHRTDGSGTTAIFTHYLAEVSPAWKKTVGASTSVSWPNGQGVKGNFGIADAIGKTEGSIGYVELSYVTELHLSAASIENKAGAYIAPSIAGAQAAAASFSTIPTDLRFYVVNAPGADAYPITGYSWIIVYQKQADGEKGKALAHLLWWMIHDGQKSAELLGYAPLPSAIVTKSEGQVRAMSCGTSAVPCFTDPVSSSTLPTRIIADLDV
jgi:phosphate transport system substrate-binding protein